MGSLKILEQELNGYSERKLLLLKRNLKEGNSPAAVCPLADDFFLERAIIATDVIKLGKE